MHAPQELEGTERVLSVSDSIPPIREPGHARPSDRRRRRLTRIQVEQALKASRAPSTERSYASMWRGWSTWCESEGYEALPAEPERIAEYLAHRVSEGMRPSSLAMVLASIGARHADEGLPDPTRAPLVRKTATGLRRLRSVPPHRMTALRGDDLEAAIETLHGTPRERHNRALLLLMRDTLARASEVAALDWRDVTDSHVTIKRSKVDQEGRGATAWISERTERALAAHVPPERRDPDHPVFAGGRGGRITVHGIAYIVRRACETAGLEGRFAAHSLRRGTATALAEAGASMPELMRAGRWTNAATVSAYIDTASPVTAQLFGGGR